MGRIGGWGSSEAVEVAGTIDGAGGRGGARGENRESPGTTPAMSTDTATARMAPAGERVAWGWRATAVGTKRQGSRRGGECDVRLDSVVGTLVWGVRCVSSQGQAEADQERHRAVQLGLGAGCRGSRVSHGREDDGSGPHLDDGRAGVRILERVT